MKVLLITDYYPAEPAGGVASHVRDLAESLRALGHEARVAAFRPTERQSCDKTAIYGTLSPPPFHPNNRDSLIEANIRLNKDLVGAVVDYKPHVIHVHDHHAGDAAVELSKKMRVPLIATQHTLFDRQAASVSGFGSELNDYMSYHMSLAMRTYTSANETIWVSKWLKESAVRRLGINTVSATVIGNGLPSWVVERPTCKPTPNTLLQVGIMAGLKNAVHSVRVLAWMPPSWSLTLVGGMTPDTARRVNEEIDSRQLSHRITLTGPVPRPEVIELMDSHEVVLAPSLEESFGIAVLEAQARQRLVVTSDRGAMPDRTGTDAGICMTSMDPKQWASRITRSLVSADVIARAARRKAQYYKWTNVASQIIAIYQRAINGG